MNGSTGRPTLTRSISRSSRRHRCRADLPPRVCRSHCRSSGQRGKTTWYCARRVHTKARILSPCSTHRNGVDAAMPPQSRHLIGSMGWWCTGVAALAGAGVDNVARAQSAASCTLENAGTGLVASVTDGRSFRLIDGREIRLAGIEVPLTARAGETSAAAAATAKAALEKLLSQGDVTLKAASRET